MIIEKIKSIDDGSKCKDRTFRVTLKAFLYDYPAAEITQLIYRLDKECLRDKEFRKKVREAVRAFEHREMEHPQPHRQE